MPPWPRHSALPAATAAAPTSASGKPAPVPSGTRSRSSISVSKCCTRSATPRSKAPPSCPQTSLGLRSSSSTTKACGLQCSAGSATSIHDRLSRHNVHASIHGPKGGTARVDTRHGCAVIRARDQLGPDGHHCVASLHRLRGAVIETVARLPWRDTHRQAFLRPPVSAAPDAWQIVLGSARDHQIARGLRADRALTGWLPRSARTRLRGRDSAAARLGNVCCEWARFLVAPCYETGECDPAGSVEQLLKNHHIVELSAVPRPAFLKLGQRHLAMPAWNRFVRHPGRRFSKASGHFDRHLSGSAPTAQAR
jgi:hypothetical protein